MALTFMNKLLVKYAEMASEYCAIRRFSPLHHLPHTQYTSHAPIPISPPFPSLPSPPAR